MKRFERMTLKELQRYHAINKQELQTRGGQVFEAGTRFQIENKHGGLELREVGGEPIRSIRKVNE